MTKQATTDPNPPQRMAEVLPETEILQHLPDEVDAGAETLLDADLPDEEITIRKEGGCGKCALNGKRKEENRYCDCTYGRQRQIRDMRSIEARFDTAGVPDRLEGATLAQLREMAGVPAMQSPAVQAVREVIDRGTASDPHHGTERKGLCILGRNGIGKSGLLVILAREVFKSGYVPLWIKYADLVRDGVQAGYGVSYAEDMELSTIRLQAAQRVHTLCLDDLGDPFGRAGSYSESKDRRDILFRILSARHERELTTHITANYADLEEIKQQFDPRIADRVKEMCAIVEMEGPNLREIE